MGELNRQALIGSIDVLLGALKMMPGRAAPVTQSGLGIEGEVQMLAKVEPEAIPVLRR